MAEQLGWQKLLCDRCDAEHFIKLVHIKFLQGGGTAEEPAGYECRKCHNIVSMAQLVSKAQLRGKEAELEALKLEVEGQKKTIPEVQKRKRGRPPKDAVAG